MKPNRKKIEKILRDNQIIIQGTSMLEQKAIRANERLTRRYQESEQVMASVKASEIKAAEIRGRIKAKLAK